MSWFDGVAYAAWRTARLRAQGYAEHFRAGVVYGAKADATWDTYGFRLAARPVAVPR